MLPQHKQISFADSTGSKHYEVNIKMVAYGNINTGRAVPRSRLAVSENLAVSANCASLSELNNATTYSLIYYPMV